MTADVHNIASRKSIGNVKGLLHSLVPRAQCFCFYDLSGTCVWSSDGADDYEIDNFIADLPREILHGEEAETRFLRRTLPSGRTVLLLAVGGDGTVSIGVLIAVFSRNAGKSSWFNPNLLKDILIPAVDVIRDLVQLDQQLTELGQRAVVAEDELKLVYKLDEKIHGTSRSHSGLAQLVGQSGRYLGIAYSVLLLPAKRIRISATHSSWKEVKRKALDRYLLETLFPRLEGHREPLIFEVPAADNPKNPAEHGYQVMLCPLLDAAGNVEGALAQLGRVSGEPFNAANIRFMAHVMRKVEHVITQSFDPMTGLMNRAGFEAQIHESLGALESKDDQHQMLFFDIDNLQLVNDTFGQKAGDEVIKRFSQILDKELPKSGVATRLTGDDFAILLANTSDDEAYDVATRIRSNSEELRYLKGDKSLQVTVSCGIAPFDNRTRDESSVLTAARLACDTAKDHGRDRIEVYDQNNQSIIRRYDDMHLVTEIQTSLDEDRFELLVQPIVSLSRKNTPARFEVLLRMRDTGGNRISSSAFFSAAERYQLMPQIDRWVVSATLSSLAPYSEFLRDSGTMFAINLSGQSLGDDDILHFIEEEIEVSGIAPETLCFEVTESAAVANLKKAQAFIDALSKRGCKFALDDFGAGLSSFAYLKNFRVDTLKIDGSFIRDITDNVISESMVAAITQVAKVMELETVAEFVETAKTKTLLRKLGVTYVQGHAVGKPTPLQPVIDELTDTAQASGA